jgi:hypothetical protein
MELQFGFSVIVWYRKTTMLIGEKTPKRWNFWLPLVSRDESGTGKIKKNIDLPAAVLNVSSGIMGIIKI